MNTVKKYRTVSFNPASRTRKMNRTPQPKTSLTALALCFSSALLVGCSASDVADLAGVDHPTDTSSSEPSTITGTVAVGQPLPNVWVTLGCQNLDDQQQQTDASGTFSFPNVPANRGACALDVAATSSTPAMHSIVDPNSHSDTITANITPLTELVFARALYNAGLSNTTVSDWMNIDHSDAEVSAVVNAVPGAVAYVVAGINNANSGDDLPAGFNPITTHFLADGIRLYDRILDALGAPAGSNMYANVDLSSPTLTLPSINATIDPSVLGIGTMTAVFSSAFYGDNHTEYDIPLPASQEEFCGVGSVAQEYAQAGVAQEYPDVQITTDCSFSNNVGTITGTVSVGSGVTAISEDFSATFTFTPTP